MLQNKGSLVGTRAPFSFYHRRVLLFHRGVTRRRVSNCNSIVFPELISFSFLFPGRDVSTLNVPIIESPDSRTTSGPTIACRRFLAHFMRVIKDLPIHDLFRSCALRARLWHVSFANVSTRQLLQDYYMTTTGLLQDCYRSKSIILGPSMSVYDTTRTRLCHF